MTSDNVSSLFLSQSLGVVGSFVKTAVVVDDLAVMEPAEDETTDETSSVRLTPPSFSGAGETEALASGLEVDSSEPRGVRLDAIAVINGFADIGAVCAVLNPSPGEDFRDRTVKAASCADIVILDWKIHDSSGEKALDVVRAILRGDGDRLRLIAIYTGEPNLNAVFEQVKAVVAEFDGSDALVEKDGLRVTKGPANVVVLAKQGTLGALHPEFQTLEVGENELAARLLLEFTLMVSSLIRNAAIAGIAAIRDNAHRILAKFDGNLDPAYLGHRLMLPYPPDAEDHLVDALGSEVLALLKERQPGGAAGADIIGAWLELRKENGLEFAEEFTFPGELNVVDGWQDLLLLGIDGRGAVLPLNTSQATLRTKATTVFSKDTNTATCSDRSFAALLNLKTQYAGQTPRLTMGTLLCIREMNNNQYFLCLQPKCDSVRLEEETGYPFIPLVPLRDTELQGGKKPLRLVVEVGEGQWKDFGITLKPSDLKVCVFRPGPNPPGEVLAVEQEAGAYYFCDITGSKFWWIAEVKDEHALGMANELANALARPGPNNAEWLRRASGSPQ